MPFGATCLLECINGSSFGRVRHNTETRQQNDAQTEPRLKETGEKNGAFYGPNQMKGDRSCERRRERHLCRAGVQAWDFKA